MDVNSKYYPLSVFKSTKQQWRRNSFLRRVKRFKTGTTIDIIYRIITQRYRKLVAISSCYVGKTIIQMLDMIIPHTYFGSTQNRKRFYHVVNKITSQSRGECIFKSSLYKGYDLECINWLQERTEGVEQQRLIKKQNLFLLRTNTYILDQIVKPLIQTFYVRVRSLKNYEIQFMPRRQWDSFQGKVFNTLLKKNHLIPGDFTNSRGRLMLFPKGDANNLNYRPVIYANKINAAVKTNYIRISKLIRNLARQFSQVSSCKVLAFWENCVKSIKNEILYGIKLDVQDAFGNVDINKICRIINESNNFNHRDKLFIINHIENQYVTYNNKIFKWSHGLLQGDHLSSALCNLYLSVLEHEHLQTFMRIDFRLHREADDYLFCSTDLEVIERFEETFKNNFPLNESKIQRSFVDGCEITYCGQLLNFHTNEVSKFFDAKETCIRHRFKFWNENRYKAKAEMIKNAVDFRFTNHYFKHFRLNITCGSEKTILINYYKAMVYVAFKFDLAVRAVSDIKQKSTDLPYLGSIIRNAIAIHARKIHNYLSGKIKYQLLRMIGKKAFILVLRKRLDFYKSIIDCIHLKKKVYLKLPDGCQGIAKSLNQMPVEFIGIEMRRKSKI